MHCVCFLPKSPALHRHVSMTTATMMMRPIQRRPLGPPLHFRVPDLTADETISAADNAFDRYSASSDPSINIRKRRGDGVAIVWFRNDLRILDNEALLKAYVSSAAVIPVYCFDPRIFGAATTTHYFGFPKTGALRASFLIECVSDLKKNLKKRGLDLIIRNGKPEDVLPCIAQAFGVHTVKTLLLKSYTVCDNPLNFLLLSFPLVWK